MRKNLLRLVLVNFGLLVSFILAVEYSSRIAVLTWRCINKFGFPGGAIEKCTPIDSLGLMKPWFMVGFSEQHPLLGYIPKEGFSSEINSPPDWDNVSVNIGPYGIRFSGYSFQEPNRKPTVITVGDSYAFGDQVNDKETWQSCLNAKQAKINYINAGVFGYGTAQALLRGNLLTKEIKPYPKLIILSHLVGHDFPRDQRIFGAGFPRPAIVKGNNKIFMAPPPEKQILGTKYYEALNSAKSIK